MLHRCQARRVAPIDAAGLQKLPGFQLVTTDASWLYPARTSARTRTRTRAMHEDEDEREDEREGDARGRARGR
jgi:hypothetical protein